MPQRLRFSSGIGWRPGRKMHMGEDYAGEPNQPITLGGGLKFVQYIPDDGGGYGNRVIIQASDGTQYSLNHLNAGPTNLRALQEKQNQQRAQKFGTPSGQASWYGPGFHGNRKLQTENCLRKTTQNIRQLIEH
jgi:murein DD-endopeptidase MepM/ murein hydrolase activator NlpD